MRDFIRAFLAAAAQTECLARLGIPSVKYPIGKREAPIIVAPRMKRTWRHHGLSIVLIVLFLITWIAGQFVTGLKEHNREKIQQGDKPLAAAEYLLSPHFIETTAENWESEFFQMFVYVVVTAFLFQKGSAESKDPNKPDEAEPKLTKRSPWAARQGGWIRALYAHSLSLAFALLFLISFAFHAWAGTHLYNEDLLRKGEEAISVLQYLGTPRFWFESFQNWQSEFLAIGSMVVLTIFLRERGSPESKPINTPHGDHAE
jgi:hypothetical protein